MTNFFLGETNKSGREDVIVYVGKHVYGVKWRNWKMMTKELDKGFGVPPKEFSVPLFYNLHLDPREEHPVLLAHPLFE